MARLMIPMHSTGFLVKKESVPSSPMTQVNYQSGLYYLFMLILIHICIGQQHPKINQYAAQSKT